MGLSGLARCFLIAVLAAMGALFDFSANAQQPDSPSGDTMRKRMESIRSRGGKMISPSSGEAAGTPSSESVPSGEAPSQDTKRLQDSPRPESSIGKEEEGGEIPLVRAEALWEAFSANVVQAEGQYSGKQVRLRGEVSTIRGDEDGATVYLVGSNALIGGGVISCRLRPQDSAKAANIRSGGEVILLGTCENKGYAGFVEAVSVSDCRIISPVTDSKQDADTKVSETSPISLQKLVSDHQNNEVAARAKYDGKKIAVRGNVVEIDRTLMGEAYVLLGGIEVMSDVYCYFDDAHVESLSSLRPEETVAIQGICRSSSGAVFDSIRLTQCVICK